MSSPDYNKFLEQACCAIMLTGQKDFIGVMTEIIGPEDFHDYQLAQIFGAGMTVIDKGQTVDVISIAEQIESDGGQSDLGLLADLAESSPSPSNAKPYAQGVAEKSKLRKAVALLEGALNSRHVDKHVTADTVIDSVMSQLIELNNQSKSVEGVSLRQAVRNAVEEIDIAFTAGDELIGIPTGLTEIDRRIKGFKDQDLVIIAARPSMGKSVYAMNIGEFNARQGKNVLVFSLEMGDASIAKRFLARLGGIHLGKLASPKELNAGDWQALNSAAGALKNLPMTIVDKGQMHVNQIRAYSRKAHAAKPLDLIVVDHIHLMQGDVAHGREREIASITGGLKALAKELNCPVIAVAQLNRSVENRPDKRPLMSDLRDSGSIEQDADIIQMLYRDDYYNEDSAMPGCLEVFTRKFRNGEVGTDYLGHDLTRSRLFDFKGAKPSEAHDAKSKKQSFGNPYKRNAR